MNPRRLLLCKLLPLAALTFWIQIIAIPACLVYYQLSQRTPVHAQRLLSSRELNPTQSRIDLARLAVDTVALRSSKLVMACNLPGGFGEILISFATTWPNVWHPAGLLLETWRSLSYPFFCLPAWWLVGRGFDGLVREVRLGGGLALLGLVLCVLFIVLALGLSFGLPTSERRDVGLVVVGFAIWAAAFGVVPLAWLWGRERSVALLRP